MCILHTTVKQYATCLSHDFITFTLTSWNGMSSMVACNPNTVWHPSRGDIYTLKRVYIHLDREREGSSGNFHIPFVFLSSNASLSVAAPMQSLWERGMPDHVRKRGEENTGPFFMLPFFCMIHLKRPSDFIGRLLPYSPLHASLSRSGSSRWTRQTYS